MQVLDEILADRSPILKRTLSERMAFEYSTSRYLVATGFSGNELAFIHDLGLQQRERGTLDRVRVVGHTNKEVPVVGSERELHRLRKRTEGAKPFRTRIDLSELFIAAIMYHDIQHSPFHLPCRIKCNIIM